MPILIDRSRKEGGNPWGIRFFTMFHQTNDAELFRTAEDLAELGCKLEGNRCAGARKRICRFTRRRWSRPTIIGPRASWWRLAIGFAKARPRPPRPTLHQNPEFVVQPRWWVSDEAVGKALRRPHAGTPTLCYKDVTSATNQRTMIAAMIPRVAVVNSAPLILTSEENTPRQTSCLLANLNSLALDFVARQKVGGVHLNFFIVEQFPIFSPDRYAEKCPWDKRTTLERWISDRVLKLTCTANDMRAAGRGRRHGPAGSQVECEGAA